MGKVKCEIKDQVIYIGSPNPMQLFEAEQLYHNFLVDAQLVGIFTDQEMMDYLTDIGLWSLEEQQFIDDLPKKLEHMKVEMYTSYTTFRGKRVEQVRRTIKRLLDESVIIFGKRHSYDAFTCEGFALTCKLQYLISVTATADNDKQLNVVDDTFLVQSLVQKYLTCRASEEDLRTIARTEPWRTIWSASKAEGQLLGIPAIMMTDEQKSLLGWSKLYESVRDSPDCPDDVVIKDDNLLDGWMIVQHRKQEQERKKQSSQKVGTSDKMSKAQEIYIPVETPEDAERIDQMNDAQARMIKRQRMQLVSEKGVVPEQYTPDAQLQLRQLAFKQMREKVKSNR